MLSQRRRVWPRRRQKRPPQGPLVARWVQPGLDHVGVQAFGRWMVVVLQLVLVAADLAIQLVHQLIDRGVKIFMAR